MTPSRWLPIVVVACALAAGCGRAIPEYRYYLLGEPEIEHVPAKGAAPAVRAPIAVGRFDARPGYAEQRLAYRPSPWRLQYYVHDLWVSRPPQVVSDHVNRFLVGSRAFADVSDGVRPPPELVLNGELRAFEEVDLPDGAWLARVELDLVLRRTRDGAALWRHPLRSERPVPNDQRTPEGVARALAEALDAGLAEALGGLVAAAQAHDAAEGGEVSEGSP